VKQQYLKTIWLIIRISWARLAGKKVKNLDLWINCYKPDTDFLMWFLETKIGIWWCNWTAPIVLGGTKK